MAHGAKLRFRIGFKAHEDQHGDQAFNNSQRHLGRGKDHKKFSEGFSDAYVCVMGNGELHSGYTVGKQITQSGGQENGKPFVYF